MDKFQKKFLDAILSGENIQEEFLAQIKPVGKLTPSDVIQVYQTDYHARLEEALGKNFEATWLLLGDEDFHLFAQEYIKLHPSSLRNLTPYGSLFPEFLKSKNQEEFVTEMAAFEKNFWDIFHLAPKKEKTLLPDELAEREFNIEHLFLSHSSIKLHDLWLLRESSDMDLSLDDFEGEEYLAVFRSEDKVEVKKLNESQFKILNLIRETKTLNPAFERLEEMKVVTTQQDWPMIFKILGYCY